MSSFEPLRPACAAGDAFAPLAPGRTATGAALGSGPFRDLDARHEPEQAAGEPDADAAAREEREAIAREAHARGVAEGRAEAERELAQLTHALGEAIREVARFRKTLLERYQGELLDLALEVARKVVDRELEQHPEHWVALIRSGVQRAVDRDHVRIRVGPPLHAFLREHLAELRAELDGVKELELLEDPALAATGCVVETSYGDLELGVESQIATIRAALGEPA